MENINSCKDIHWSTIETNVFRLQLRIYKAAVNQEFEKMNKIQKLLIFSKSAKYLSVKRVIQNNDDRSNYILRTSKFKPCDNKHPIAISTIEDRSKQILIYFALSPQWEVEFQAENSIFRPCKSKLEAIQYIFLGISRNPKWVLSAEILKSFNQINYEYLLEKYNTFPELSQKIRVCLKSGILDRDKYIFSELNTPLSCLLLNIVFHELGKCIEAYIKNINGHCPYFTFVHYTTDFVIFYNDKKVLKNLNKVILEFLEPIGLELNSKKTKITHTLSPGFIFLGFNIFQRTKWVKVQKVVKKRNSNLQFITRIVPSKDSLKKHKLQIREIIRRYRGASQERLIQKLNPVIRNWALAKRTQMSSKTFQSLDQFMFLHLWKWGKSRHPMMSNYKLKKKYWHNVGTKNWVFGVETNSEIILQLHSKIPIKFIGLSDQKEVF